MDDLRMTRTPVNYKQAIGRMRRLSPKQEAVVGFLIGQVRKRLPRADVQLVREAVFAALERRLAVPCHICKRPMTPYDVAKPDDPAMDCGGDCQSCMADVGDPDCAKRLGRNLPK